MKKLKIRAFPHKFLDTLIIEHRWEVILETGVLWRCHKSSLTYQVTLVGTQSPERRWHQTSPNLGKPSNDAELLGFPLFLDSLLI